MSWECSAPSVTTILLTTPNVVSLELTPPRPYLHEVHYSTHVVFSVIYVDLEWRHIEISSLGRTLKTIFKFDTIQYKSFLSF